MKKIILRTGIFLLFICFVALIGHITGLINLKKIWSNLEKFYFSVSVNKINSTESLMKKIYVRYYGKWFKQVAFSQTADSYENDTVVKSEIWDEEYCFPSNLLIYLTPGDTSNRYIFRNDSVLTYENNVLKSEQKSTHDVIILSMDIYNMTCRQIMKRWKDLPYDTKKFHQTVCDGKNYYVVGAVEGDTTSNQIWFDAEQLFFVKMRKQTPQGIKEVNFFNYMQLPDGKGWIEQEVEFRLNGKVYMREKYFNIIPQNKFDKRDLIRQSDRGLDL
ncbi:MAG: hypothetical protein LBF04_02980 [Prevotellaceae bacterium]|jgi:hypothetical protein|nr:hypothetical protein [Prevotellaceae bacterium]